MNVLMIINGSAYGLDSTYNAIRLTASLAKRGGVRLGDDRWKAAEDTGEISGEWL